MTHVYFIYETKNITTGKFYIGSHKATNIEFDGYLGSGKKLKCAINKYGIESFSRKILEIITYTDTALTQQEWHNIVYPVETKWILDYMSKGIPLYNICESGAFGGNVTGNTKWCYDPITKAHKMLYSHQELPDNWVYGRINNTSGLSQKGQKLYTNIITKEEARFSNTPDLTIWELGSQYQKSIRNGSDNPSFGKKWYKNLKSKQYYYGSKCIDGFILGRPDWNSVNYTSDKWEKISNING